MVATINVKYLLMTWGMILLGVIMDVFGAFVVKIKINELGAVNYSSIKFVYLFFWELLKYPPAVAGGIVILLSPIPYALALSRLEVSTAYPVLVAFNSMLLLPVSIIFLGEAFTFNKIIGFIFLVIALIFLYK